MYIIHILYREYSPLRGRLLAYRTICERAGLTASRSVYAGLDDRRALCILCVCVCVCIYIYMLYVYNVYIHIYIYIHTRIGEALRPECSLTASWQREAKCKGQMDLFGHSTRRLALVWYLSASVGVFLGHVLYVEEGPQRETKRTRLATKGTVAEDRLVSRAFMPSVWGVGPGRAPAGCWPWPRAHAVCCVCVLCDQ